jgi:hypothetical protein
MDSRPLQQPPIYRCQWINPDTGLPCPNTHPYSNKSNLKRHTNTHKKPSLHLAPVDNGPVPLPLSEAPRNVPSGLSLSESLAVAQNEVVAMAQTLQRRASLRGIRSRGEQRHSSGALQNHGYGATVETGLAEGDTFVGFLGEVHTYLIYRLRDGQLTCTRRGLWPRASSLGRELYSLLLARMARSQRAYKYSARNLLLLPIARSQRARSHLYAPPIRKLLLAPMARSQPAHSQLCAPSTRNLLLLHMARTQRAHSQLCSPLRTKITTARDLRARHPKLDLLSAPCTTKIPQPRGRMKPHQLWIAMTQAAQRTTYP